MAAATGHFVVLVWGGGGVELLLDLDLLLGKEIEKEEDIKGNIKEEDDGHELLIDAEHELLIDAEHELRSCPAKWRIHSHPGSRRSRSRPASKRILVRQGTRWHFIRR
jgi:hypothetical protein